MQGIGAGGRNATRANKAGINPFIRSIRDIQKKEQKRGNMAFQ